MIDNREEILAGLMLAATAVLWIWGAPLIAGRLLGII